MNLLRVVESPAPDGADFRLFYVGDSPPTSYILQGEAFGEGPGKLLFPAVQTTRGGKLDYDPDETKTRPRVCLCGCTLFRITQGGYETSATCGNCGAEDVVHDG